MKSTHLPILDTIMDAYRSALRALPSIAPQWGVFILTTALATILPVWMGSGLGSLATALVLVFWAGCFYSAAAYRVLLGDAFHATRPTLGLLKANALVYLCFSFISFFLVFFLAITASILISVATGIDYDAASQDPTLMNEALADMADTPYGWLLWLIVLAGLGVVSFFALRLFLFGAASMVKGETWIFRTWGWTKGHLTSLGLVALFTHILPLGGVLLLMVLLPSGEEALARALSGGLSAALGGLAVLPGHGAAVISIHSLRQDGAVVPDPS